MPRAIPLRVPRECQSAQIARLGVLVRPIDIAEPTCRRRSLRSWSISHLLPSLWGIIAAARGPCAWFASGDLIVVGGGLPGLPAQTANPLRSLHTLNGVSQSSVS